MQGKLICSAMLQIHHELQEAQPAKVKITPQYLGSMLQYYTYGHKKF